MWPITASILLQAPRVPRSHYDSWTSAPNLSPTSSRFLSSSIRRYLFHLTRNGSSTRQSIRTAAISCWLKTSTGAASAETIANRHRPSRQRGDHCMEFASASPGRLDGGNVDLLHRHHRLEGTLGFTAPSRKRIGERARGDLPGEAPAVLTPTTLAFGTAITDDRVPVSVRLFLILRRDLEGKGFAVPERRAAAETET